MPLDSLFITTVCLMTEDMYMCIMTSEARDACKQCIAMIFLCIINISMCKMVLNF